jgi:lipopolysaccharide/colanic/teichoic acid biosynthesis glycosyltransferase
VTEQLNRTADECVSTAPVRVPLPRPHLVRHDPEEFEARGAQIWANAAAGRAHEQSSRGRIGSILKRVLDIVGALALGILFSPLIFLIVIMMYRDPAPIIYKHRRVGRGGKMFECLKFRTMVPNAQQVLRELLDREPALKAEWLRHHKLRDDPRVTSIGKLLRRTSLDELPQIWNVIRGEMSLVGPRPVEREELLRYGKHAIAYLSAKPGITGLWQVTGRNDVDYRRRIAMDVCYVRKHTVLLDLYILLKTMRVVLIGDGAY